MNGGPRPMGSARYRWTIRRRLTLTYTALMLVFGLGLTTAVYLFMRYVPDYQFNSATLTEIPGARPSLDDITPGQAVPTGLVVNSTGDLLTTLLITSGVALMVLGCAAAAVGWLTTGRMLRPLNDITAAAKNAGSGLLDRRIALSGPQDELKDLSDTFDTMLARLEQAFHAHQRFAANASHELRTPLATTQAILDVAIADPDSHDVHTLATKLRLVNRQSIDTVDALLDLAETANSHTVGQNVDLAPVIHRTVSAITDEAAGAGVRVETLVQDCTVRADPVLMRQLILNLLQNAVRYNVCGGSITVTTALHDASVTVRVSNTGPHIAEEVLPLLTEPFYRGEGRTVSNRAPRSRGLGLALTSAIATAHGADLALSANSGGGLTVGITLPLAQEQESATVVPLAPHATRPRH